MLNQLIFFAGQVEAQSASTGTILLSLGFMPQARPQLGFIYIFGSWYVFEVDTFIASPLSCDPCCLLANRSLPCNDIKAPS